MTQPTQPATTTYGPDISLLERQRLAIKSRIDDLTAKIGDPATDAGEKYLAQQQLDKANTDYTQILIAMKPSAGNEVTRGDGSVWRIGPDNKAVQVLGPGGKALGTNTVGTNTTEQYIVTVNQETGALETVKNPNYVAPKPGQVSANTSDEFIVQQNPDGTLNPVKNPNYQPKPSQISANSTDQFIVQQMPDGTVKSSPNPNYQAKTATVVGGTTGSDQQFIIKQNPDGTTTQIPNPNYVPKTPTTVGTTASTDSPFIMQQLPNGELKQVPNPNYIPKTPQTVTTQSDSPFIVQQKPDGTISQVPNPNYKAPKPTQVTGAGGDQAFISMIDAQGNITSQPNPSFQPKTMADVAARRAQLQTTMAAKSAEVQGKVGTTINGKLYTADDALRDYNNWHTQNIAPQIGSLQAAADAAQLAQARDIATTRTAAQTAATGAGTMAVNAANAYREMNPVGPGFRDAMNQMSANFKYLPKNMGDAITYNAPNPMFSAQQASQNALKYIDPTVAAASGMPPPNVQNMSPQDLQAALGAARYAPQSVGAPAPAAPQAPPPVAPAQGGIGNPTTFEEWKARQAQDAAAQGIQAGIGQTTWTPPGGSSYANAGPPPWAGAQPQTLQQQYGTANPWDIYAPDYTYG